MRQADENGEVGGRGHRHWPASLTSDQANSLATMDVIATSCTGHYGPWLFIYIDCYEHFVLNEHNFLFLWDNCTVLKCLGHMVVAGLIF